ncbi:uncharacterized protein LOC132172581 isoform X2 [Corylus avellana]|uniref:uncharacterized protein LOC132172581 isoform X2 n=1 Tax=Corylus avellana TaxID=13451 RepID=UPI00286CF3F8|nr:uncharacterized protein LOC132172581 isoform X2 [Corylus avellana]
MEVEKRRSKGGFLNLFDWNGKSRKKLFSNNSDLPGLKQERENVENVSKSWLNRVEVDENGASSSSSNKGSSDSNCPLLVTGDEGGGARAPGVVARLMGLDSLPASNVPESSSAPCFDYSSFRPSLYDRSNPNLLSDYHRMDYINMPNKLEKSSWNPLESRTKKLQNRPIERFQTEVLPPKSAKSIPITHHRLLSPIKGPGYIPTKNLAYMLEAAAKIMDASPRASTKNNMSSFGSSSVPLRIRDLREKLEGGHRASRPERLKEPSAVKYKRGQPYDGSKKGYASESKSSTNSETSGSYSLRSKKKSVSLAEQAKVNVQRRTGSTLSNNRNFMNQKEPNDVKSNQLTKKQPSMQRTAQKRTSASRTSNALRQNNQKQNSSSNIDSSSSKVSVSNKLARRTRSIDGSVGPTKIVNKVVVNSETGAKKLSSVATHTEKEFLLSKRSKVSQKKMSADGDVHIEENIIDDALINNDESSRKCNVAIDGCLNSGADNMKQGMDVISFTFMSPLRRCTHEVQSSSQVMGKHSRFSNDSFGDNDQFLPDNFNLSSPGLNVTGGDALSVLLQQKLQELTLRVDSSHDNLVREGTCASLASSLQDSVPNLVSSKSREQSKRFQFGLHRNKFDSIQDYDYSSVDDLPQNVNQQRQFQVSEGMKEHSSCSIDSATVEELDCLHPRPASSFEHSFGGESFSDNSQSTSGSTKCSLEQAQESFSWHSTKESLPVGGEVELSDSASSMPTGDVGTKHISRTFSFIGFKGSSNRELEYVRDILKNTQLMLEDFELGHTSKIVAPNLFDQLDNQGNGEEHFKLGRKVIFDCVSECLDLRYSEIVDGSCKSWAKWVTMSGKKVWLAEELYKEILGWKSMEDMMVDQLVDKDMSTQCGRWLDFDKEAFEEGVEIEKGILASLVDELVYDILHL